MSRQIYHAYVDAAERMLEEDVTANKAGIGSTAARQGAARAAPLRRLFWVSEVCFAFSTGGVGGTRTRGSDFARGIGLSCDLHLY